MSQKPSLSSGPPPSQAATVRAPSHAPSRAPARVPSKAPTQTASRAPTQASKAPTQVASKAPTQVASRPPTQVATVRAPSTTASQAASVSSSPASTVRAPSHAPSRPPGAPSQAPASSLTATARLKNAGQALLEARERKSTARPSMASSVRSTALGSSGMRSVYRDPDDLQRAETQVSYRSLTACERVLQDKWALQKATDLAPCPANFTWSREEDSQCPGYRCMGGSHFISDGIIAEGVPGMYVLRSGINTKEPPGIDRRPPTSEGVPKGFRGPCRPVGVNVEGRLVYYAAEVNREQTRSYDPDMQRALGWIK